MKKYYFLMVVLAFSQPAKAEKIPFDAGEYKIDFYCEPELAHHSSVNSTFQCQNDYEYFYVTRRKLSPEAVEAAESDIHEFVAGYVEAMARPHEGVVTDIQDIGEEGETKYRYQFETKSEIKHVVHGIVVIADMKLFDVNMVSVLMHGHKLDSEKANDFLGSFELPSTAMPSR